MFWHLDPIYYLIALPGILLGIFAQIRLSSAYNKYKEIGVESGLTGAEAARQILDRSGLTDVPVEEVPGHLTDHYDPTKRALFLSEENFRGRSVAAVGVAAHEAGHALQHKEAYAPLNLRMAMVPVTRFASFAYLGIFGLGMAFRLAPLSTLIWVAIGVFSVIAFFQLVTLPVEFDASSRAKEQLFRLGLVREQEREGVAKVLNAAALTYVAALVTALIELLYWLDRARRS